MIKDYTQDLLRARSAGVNFLSYTDASIKNLMMALAPLDFQYSYAEEMAMAKNPQGKALEEMEKLHKAVSELEQLHEEGYHMIPIWPEGNMPKVRSCEEREEGLMAFLEDDPGYVPVLYDMCLPEPEKAMGTVIFSPSVRACINELLYPVRKWQEMGYNCFGVGVRFNTRVRKGGPGEIDPEGFVFCHSFPEEILDMQRAIRYVKYHAKAFGIDPDRIITLGFSKGNCANYLSSDFFDVLPEDVRFEKIDGSYEQIMPGYKSDDIDHISANVPVNIFVYGDMMLTKDGKTPIITDSRIYTKENMEKGYKFPACYFMVGNYDRIAWSVLQGFSDNNADPNRLYEIPYEVHVYDGVPHGVCLGEDYPNYYSSWENADLFCMTHLERLKK